MFVGLFVGSVMSFVGSDFLGKITFEFNLQNYTRTI